jgi:hypothetical protein
MRNPALLSAVALATLLLSNLTAHADAATSCRTEAALAADEWAKGNMASATDGAQEVDEPVLIISGGRKYVASSNAVDAETLRPHLLGNMVIERNQVYEEELDRCLGHLTMKIVGKHPHLLEQVEDEHSGHQ